MYLTKLAQRHGDNDQRVDYKDLAAVVQRKVNKTMCFRVLLSFLNCLNPDKTQLSNNFNYLFFRRAGQHGVPARHRAEEDHVRQVPRDDQERQGQQRQHRRDHVEVGLS